ncbi:MULTISPECIES: iron ABC transporter permease [Methanoculleus]|jgi:iron complex transport system permease protein|uniref:Cobalamin import system permease protein BtuC n=1 Tax=Methanoculleus thermophilus TaxID=2200 RepID=A0A1G8XBA6_9EURY|nr:MULTISPECIES: iron ABC transporter permease [Methanoculleus]NLN09453.1 iron ABC transporter permease [Methanoculleus thermophilus]SDJ87918.1 iron complex transport system permease protein [Methanoculleus thermophilus]HQD25139.1 iron ABC transporter permease [Methanoculleus thermophilus]
MRQRPTKTGVQTDGGTTVTGTAVANQATSRSWGERHPGTILVLLLGVLGVVIFIALMAGRYMIPPETVIATIISSVYPIEMTWAATATSAIVDVRIPRIIAGLLVGAGLAISGASFQGMFRNPLVSSEILGVASGAGFGAAIGILLLDSLVLVQILSFVFGLLAVGMAYALSRVRSSTPILMLVLAGIVIGSLFSALTSMAKYVADPMNKMPAIVFWLLGSLNHVSASDLMILGPIIIVSIAGLLAVRWRINVLTMGDEEARALGVNTEHLKAIIIFLSTVITAAAVCLSGIIGWIGLVIPHMGRMLVGPDNRYLLPVSVLLGGAFLIAVDTIARTAAPAEIPIGILTAVIGAPIFAVLLRRNNPGW